MRRKGMAEVDCGTKTLSGAVWENADAAAENMSAAVMKPRTEVRIVPAVMMV
jgi:hypothetical protein